MSSWLSLLFLFFALLSSLGLPIGRMYISHQCRSLDNGRTDDLGSRIWICYSCQVLSAKTNLICSQHFMSAQVKNDLFITRQDSIARTDVYTHTKSATAKMHSMYIVLSKKSLSHLKIIFFSNCEVLILL